MVIALAWLVACRSPAEPSRSSSPTDPTPTGSTGSTDTAPLGPTAATGHTAAPSTASPGCADGAPAPPSGPLALVDQGVTRAVQLFVPSTHADDQPAPLVLVFHGWGGDEDEFLGDEAVRALSEARGVVVAAPRGLGSGPPDRWLNAWSFTGSTTGLSPSGQPICDVAETADYRYPSCRDGEPPIAQNTCAWTHCQVDDVAFALALVEELGRQICVDTARVYAVGGSNGGMFTWELGQRAPEVFAGIAPIIGLPHADHTVAGDVPVLLVTGTRDRTVPPGAWEDPAQTVTTDGDRFVYTGATAITRSWAAARGCDVSVPAAPFDDGRELTDCRSTCAAAGGWPEVLDCRVDMGHTYGLSWSWELVLDFFEATAR